MGKSMRAIVVMLSLVMIVAGIGCVAVSKHATPAEVDRKSVHYVAKTGVADANEFDGYSNLAKAEKLKRDVDVAHTVIQFEIQQLKEKDDLDYSIRKKVAAKNYAVGQQREEMLFGEKGLLSLGLSMAGFETLTGFVGLMRKRPGDITSQDLGLCVEQATGKTAAELSAKEKQVIQIVKGLQVFMKSYEKTTDNKEAAMMKELRIACNEAQDKDTQAAIAVIKKTS